MPPILLRSPPPLPTLRDRETGTAAFRTASRKLASLLIRELKKIFREKHVDERTLIFTVILRSGIALLPSALDAYPGAKVAVLGLRRNEKTKKAYWYYENMPKITRSHIIAILDPMLATGGSAVQAVQRFLDRGADARKMYFVGVIAAPEGLERLARLIPEGNVILAALDKGLDARKFIVPGLGDFGDRYFGYKEPTGAAERSVI